MVIEKTPVTLIGSLSIGGVGWNPKKVLAKSAGGFLLLALVFSISYTQKPLYNDNQKVHFVIGLADGGLGSLKEDWYANITDPHPTLSLLVSFTYRYFHEYLFYGFYVLILGIYIYGILGIAASIFNIGNSRSKYLAFLALIVGIHSGVAGWVASEAFGLHPRGLQSGVAGQSLLGPVFQPSVFGVFLILSIYVFLRKKPFLSVFFLALAATFHATYLLAAAVLTLSYMIITLREGENTKRALLIGLFGFILVLPILSYVFLSFGRPSSPVIWNKANEVLASFRIPHHADPGVWLKPVNYAKILIMIGAVYIARKTKLFLILLLSLSVAAGLTVLQVLSGSYSLALLFPWRISTFLFPLSTSIIIARFLSAVFERFRHQTLEHGRAIVGTSTIAISGLVLGGGLLMFSSFKQYSQSESIPMMNYIRETKQSGDVYLIPPRQLTKFRVHTGAPIYVDFKGAAFRDVEVLEWYERFVLAEAFYSSGQIECKAVKELPSGWGVTHIILSDSRVDPECTGITPTYIDDVYRVYKING